MSLFEIYLLVKQSQSWQTHQDSIKDCWLARSNKSRELAKEFKLLTPSSSTKDPFSHLIRIVLLLRTSVIQGTELKEIENLVESHRETIVVEKIVQDMKDISESLIYEGLRIYSELVDKRIHDASEVLESKNAERISVPSFENVISLNFEGDVKRH